MKDDLARIVEVSVQAVCDSKSRAHPYVANNQLGLWVLQDGPGKKRNPRKSEVFSVGLDPEDTVRRIEELGVGWHFLCVACQNDANFKDLREQYKSLGYRSLGTEWFFVHDLDKGIPVFESEPPVRLVSSAEDLEAIPQLASHKRHFRENGIRNYCIWDGDRDYGWVFSVPYGGTCWVSDLFVYSDVRSRGYGKALMSRMLRDDRELGVGSSILIASSAGARIYPSLGYRQVGVLQVFCPTKR